MSYLYKNTFESVYEADVGEIVKIKDSKIGRASCRERV